MNSNPTKSTRKRTNSGDIVNCEKAGRGVWLVKVPRYLSEIWEKHAGNDVGRLITGTGPAGDEVLFKSKVLASSSSLINDVIFFYKSLIKTIRTLQMLHCLVAEYQHVMEGFQSLFHWVKKTLLIQLFLMSIGLLFAI